MYVIVQRSFFHSWQTSIIYTMITKRALCFQISVNFLVKNIQKRFEWKNASLKVNKLSQGPSQLLQSQRENDRVQHGLTHKQHRAHLIQHRTAECHERNQIVKHGNRRPTHGRTDRQQHQQDITFRMEQSSPSVPPKPLPRRWHPQWVTILTQSLVESTSRYARRRHLGAT